MSEDLTTQEAIRLEQCEATIEEGLQTFVEVGKALLAIRDERLYRETHRTFDDYLRARWGMSDRQARRLIDAAETVIAIREAIESGPIGPELHASPTDTTVVRDVVLPANEAQARPLTQLPKGDRPAAWIDVQATAPGGKVTAKHVEGVVAERKVPKAAPSAPPVVDDSKIAVIHSPDLGELRNLISDFAFQVSKFANDAEHLLKRLPANQRGQGALLVHGATQEVVTLFQALHQTVKAPAEAQP